VGDRARQEGLEEIAQPAHAGLRLQQQRLQHAPCESNSASASASVSYASVPVSIAVSLAGPPSTAPARPSLSHKVNPYLDSAGYRWAGDGPVKPAKFPGPSPLPLPLPRSLLRPSFPLAHSHLDVRLLPQDPPQHRRHWRQRQHQRSGVLQIAIRRK
jgi:hypothetical protein